VWSVSQRAELNLPCGSGQFYRADQPFDVALKLEPYGQQDVTIRAGEQVLWQGPLRAGGPETRFTVPPANCKQGVSTVVLDISNPTRPSDDGKSRDNRALGVSLFGLHFLGQPR
jgi:hypothetical protein